LPQLQTFVTSSKQGGQLPTWHFSVHWCPQGSVFLQLPKQVGCGVVQRMGGSIFVSPQGHAKG